MAAAASTKPALTWKTRLTTSVASALIDFSIRQDGSVNRRLTNLWDIQSSPNPSPINSVSSSDVTVDPARRLWFRLFTPVTESCHSLPVVVFFHGGGFTFLSAASKSYDAVCRRFAGEIPLLSSPLITVCPPNTVTLPNTTTDSTSSNSSTKIAIPCCCHHMLTCQSVFWPVIVQVPTWPTTWRFGLPSLNSGS